MKRKHLSNRKIVILNKFIIYLHGWLSVAGIINKYSLLCKALQETLKSFNKFNQISTKMSEE